MKKKRMKKKQKKQKNKIKMRRMHEGMMSHAEPPTHAPAGLCQVHLSCDAQLQREVLQEHGQDAGEQDHAHQRVAVRAAPVDVRGPVP